MQTLARLTEQAANAIHAIQAKTEESCEEQAGEILAKFEGIVDKTIKESEGRYQSKLRELELHLQDLQDHLSTNQPWPATSAQRPFSVGGEAMEQAVGISAQALQKQYKDFKCIS